MEQSEPNKKPWIRPEVHTLNIKKDTFSGSAGGPEGAGYDGPPLPPG